MADAGAADRAFRQAGLDRADIDVFSLYDTTSFEVIRQFEMLGYCEEGDGGAFVADGRIRLGRCGVRQVAGAEHALVTVAGGPARFYGVTVLSSVPG